MPVRASIHEFLRQAQVAYAVVLNGPAVTAESAGVATQMPVRSRAKVVVCFVDGVPIQAVVPASLTVNLTRLADLARGRDIRLAREDELRQLFPDCEPGAAPPLGPLYGQPVFVDVTLAGEPEVVFSAGTHSETIRMKWADFAAAIRPIVGRFADPPLDHVGQFRLSYRE